jgi:VWFA-related protein
LSAFASHRRRRTAAAASVILTGALAGVAQQQAPPPETPPQQPVFRVEANYVRVDAFVTENDRPVRGLTKDDFEVFEDGAPQEVAAFEHVEVRSAGPAAPPGREPQTVADSRELARDPRSRVFVLFLDTYHTGVAGSHGMQRALVSLLERLLGPDDLVAVMTPEMSASDIVLARRTGSIEAMLSRYWYWGRRERITDRDPQEDDYEACYPPWTYGDVAQVMIARRREKLVLDALTDLAVHLRDLREERKAVLTVSEGWRLYRQDRALAEVRERSETIHAPGVGPTGELTADPDRAQRALPRAECERDRLTLAMLDNDRLYRDIFDIANRANVTFYTLDPRGLPAFDSSIAHTERSPSGVAQPVPPAVDQARLRDRIETLRTLAVNTDGIAVVNSNDIDAGLRRIADDLTSYYLLGYYSTNDALDGTFRRISVRVKRPGMAVRARRGYRAATAEEVERARSTAAVASPVSAVQAAIDGLSAARADLRLRTLAGWMPGGQAGETGLRAWAVVELDPTTARSVEWTAGANAELRLIDAGGQPVATMETAIAPGGRTLVAEFPDVPLATGEYAVRVRLRPSTGGGLPLADTVRFRVLDAATPVGRARLSRRGPMTGGRFVPTADARFRRTERVQLEWAIAGEPGSDPGAELLDRTGRPMSVPVAVTSRTDERGLRWLAADVVLAPLAEGDYAVRVRALWGGATHEVVAALRVVP